MPEGRVRSRKRVEGRRVRITVLGAVTLVAMAVVIVWVLRNLQTNEPEPTA